MSVKENLNEILEETKNAILKQYQKLLELGEERGELEARLDEVYQQWGEVSEL